MPTSVGSSTPSTTDGWCKFVEHRIADQRVVRLIQKWLNAGVMEKASGRASEEGTPQGATVSPLLANIYLHYVFDLLGPAMEEEACTRRRHRRALRGRLRRWVSSTETDAERFSARAERATAQRSAWSCTRARRASSSLAASRPSAGEEHAARGKPETFNFLGFTHICGRSREGKFLLATADDAEADAAKLHEVKDANCSGACTSPSRSKGGGSSAVVRGYFRVLRRAHQRARALSAFRTQVARLWQRALRRRSQKRRHAVGADATAGRRAGSREPPIHILGLSSALTRQTRGKSPVR